ncbi:phage tail protein [Escherichia coli]|uniref:Phage tail protein n=1 Tax=Salmonella montevideo TaxID=115981 RepID=A0A5Y2YT51_SALMO|nr:phage tail protein [Salmonella enterica subsp. enterica serovar Montevideo]EAM8139366.1 phage tail protein [Salmonella enterica]EBH3545291.1 phage tail protein [Salmonella enterica subsp. enterica serovar Infantis]MDN0330870.1 phage tail protein [Escherichia coli]EAN8793631.1 phage tail protein [Salmonella enterica]
MSTKFKTVITTAGAAKLAAATAPGGRKVNITTMAVGDGGGKLPVPDAGQTGLIHEVWRHALNKISQDKRNSNYIIAELVIPPEVGGFWMRELGLYDDAGTLIAVANMAESYKPALAEGSGRSQTCRMVIIVSSVASVALTIDTTTVMATQDYVDDKIAEHEQSRRHPDASLTAKGFTQLSSATNSTSETLAATPKAVKTAYDLANGKYTAQDATTARKGLVQLSSATNSTSETLAATPKAVKAAYDLANGKYTAQDATTARKGLVQLSSATNSDSETLAATPKAVKTAYDLANGKYTAQDATTARKGLVQLSSATNSDSETLAATPKAVKSANDNAEKRLQKDKNGADIPDKERFLSNINVYSKGEVDKKKGMRKYSFAAPANVVAGKWYPVIFRRAASLSGEMASRVVISTGCYNGDYVMNNCEFNGMVMPGGWTDRGSYAAGYFWTYQTNERSIHSIVTSLKDDDVCSVFYVEARAFPVQILAEEGLTVIVPTEDYVVGQTTYKWGATNPATESTNAQAILDFKNGRGYYCSHPFISSLSGNAATATKLANARNINGVRFDGSADININTLVSRNRVTALGGSVKGTPGIQMYEAYNNGYPTAYGNVLHLTGVTAVGEGELLIGWSGTSGAHAPAYIRSRRDTTNANWSGWAQLYTTAHKPSAGDVGAYTKAESDSRYVRDIRLGTRVVQTMQKGVMYEKAGHVITGLGIVGEVDGDDPAVFRPIQKYINGTWYNVAQV